MKKIPASEYMQYDKFLRETNEPHDVSFEDFKIIDKLLKSKKLTDRQKEAIKSLVKYYDSTD